MNPIRHYRISRKTDGRLISLLSLLPDMFIIVRTLIPVYPIKQFCLDAHNTQKAIEATAKISSGLGRAWALHREQDIKSHEFTYDFADSIPADSLLLLSGGLDSFIQWRLLGQPKAIHFIIGHRAQGRETRAIRKIQERFGGEIIFDTNLNLGQYEMSNGYIPYRNLFFIMQASLHSPNIIMCQIAEWAPDKNKGFYRRTEKLLKEIGTGSFQGISMNPKIYAPFAGYTKTKLVREYLKRYPAEDLINYTVSCYSGNIKPCGKCTACWSRYLAMENNDIHEEYESIPDYSNFKKRFSIRDFRFSNIPMYYKRAMELREFSKR